MAGHLTAAERDRIAELHCRGASQKEIAAALTRDPATICRELRRNRAGEQYYAAQAQGSLHQVHQGCGLRIQYRKHCPTRGEVPGDAIVKTKRCGATAPLARLADAPRAIGRPDCPGSRRPASVSYKPERGSIL